MPTLIRRILTALRRLLFGWIRPDRVVDRGTMSSQWVAAQRASRSDR
jgi:hypothetical protein